MKTIKPSLSASSKEAVVVLRKIKKNDQTKEFLFSAAEKLLTYEAKNRLKEWELIPDSKYTFTDGKLNASGSNSSDQGTASQAGASASGV